jgi:hypothetical protein
MGMAKVGHVAERLRARVRARVRRDGEHYEWGSASRLAEALKVSPGWVTEYTDDPPTRHATIDQAFAICAFYGINPIDLAAGTRQGQSRRLSVDPLVRGFDEALQTGKVDRGVFLDLVNTMRRQVGLPAIQRARARKRAG